MNLNNEEGFLFEKDNDFILSRFETMLRKEDIIYFDISEFIEIIELYLDNSNLERAKLAINIGLSQHPQANELMLKKAHVLVESQKYKEAKSILLNIEKIEPSNPDIALLLGIVNLYNFETNKSIAYFNRAIQQNQDDAEEIILNIAIHFENVKLFDQAVYFLKTGYDINSENPDIIYELAYSYEKTGKYRLGIEFYTKYLEINPFSENAWYNLALTFDKLEDYDKAIEAFDFALAIDDEYLLAYYGKGNTLANKDNYKEAAEVFKEALELEPENDELLYSIGECYEKLKDYKQSLKYYKKTLDINDKNSNAWFGIGIIRYYKNEFFESLFYVKKALKLNPDDSEFWSTLGDINDKLCFYDDAEIAYKSALELDPFDENIWISYSDLLYKQEKIEEAVTALTEANNKIKDNSEIIFRLSAYLLESNQHNKAVEYFKLGLSIDYEMHKKFFHFDKKTIHSLSSNNLIKKHLTTKNSSNE